MNITANFNFTYCIYIATTTHISADIPENPSPCTSNFNISKVLTRQKSHH